MFHNNNEDDVDWIRNPFSLNQLGGENRQMLLSGFEGDNEEVQSLSSSIYSQSPLDDLDETYMTRVMDISHLSFEVPGLSSEALLFLKYLQRTAEWMKEIIPPINISSPHYPSSLHITWNAKKKQILLNHRPITPEFLVYFLIEYSLGLFDSQGRQLILQAGGGEKIILNKCVVQMYEFFAKTEILSEIKNRIMNKLLLLTLNRKSGIQIGLTLSQSTISSCLLELISYGLFKTYINDDDILFFMKETPKCFFVLKDLFALDKFSKLENIRSQTTCYEPWLLVLRNSLLLVETQYQDLLVKDSKFFEECLHVVIQWLNAPSKISLISWIFEFLFRDFYDETKRKFLYLVGDSDTGKTSFITQYLLPDKYFQTMFLNMQHFALGPKRGDYELHCLIFDDPGIADGRNNHLDGEFFLNLARYDQKAHSFNIKNGHFRVLKGQICFISNRGEDAMFKKSHQKSMSTRLLKMYFDQKSPFPLTYPSPFSQPLIIKSLDLHNEKGGFSSPPPPLPKHREQQNVLLSSSSRKIFKVCKNNNNKKKKRNETNYNNQNTYNNKLPQEDHEHLFIKDNRLTKDLVFYLTWMGILTLLQAQIPLQSPETLELFIPNPHFRQRILECIQKDISLYEFLVSILTVQELKQYLIYSNKEANFIVTHFLFPY